jgi:hypothetical protein
MFLATLSSTSGTQHSGQPYRVGSPPYVAPEVWKNCPWDHEAGWYSFGIVMLWLHHCTPLPDLCTHWNIKLAASVPTGEDHKLMQTLLTEVESIRQTVKLAHQEIGSRIETMPRERSTHEQVLDQLGIRYSISPQFMTSLNVVWKGFGKALTEHPRSTTIPFTDEECL